jgi:hypothetical protein
MNCRLLSLCACFAVFSVIDSDAGPGVSGIYIATSADGLTKLQLIEASAGAVSGEFIELTVDGNGRLHDERATIAGVVEGSSLILALSPVSFSPIPTMLSGIVRDDEIAVTGAGTGRNIAAHLLRRGARREFDVAADRLRDLSHGRLEARVADVNASQQSPVGTADQCGCGGEKAARIRQENRRQIENAHTLLDGMNDLLAAADRRLEEFPSIAARYVSTTVQARADLARLNDLAAASSMDSPVGKSDLVAAIGRRGLSTLQLHAGIQAVALEFRASESALTAELDKTESICRARQPVTGDVTSGGMPWESLCRRLLETGERYRRVVFLFDKELVGLEEIYRTEREAQDRIIVAADAFK